MAIDARIQSVRHKPNKHILRLVGRLPGEMPGRRELHITRNPDYTPHAGDLIWGNAHECKIGRHSFRRIMQLHDGSEEVL